MLLSLFRPFRARCGPLMVHLCAPKCLAGAQFVEQGRTRIAIQRLPMESGAPITRQPAKLVCNFSVFSALCRNSF